MRRDTYVVLPAANTTCVSVEPTMMVGWPPMMFNASLKASAGTFSSKLPSSEDVSTWVSHTARR